MPHAWSADWSEKVAKLPSFQSDRAQTDWLIDDSLFKAGVFRTGRVDELVLSNGLVARTFRLSPNAATVGLRNLMTDQEMVRSVRPEAEISLNGKNHVIGGLTGQSNGAFLQAQELDNLKAIPGAFQLVDVKWGEPVALFDWKPRKEWISTKPKAWPAPGTRLTLTFAPPSGTSLGGEVAREVLYSQEFGDFGDMPKGWTLHESQSHTRNSFNNEGKPGEIMALPDVAVYAERPLPADTTVVECQIDPGTDQSVSWGPGLTLVWKDRTVKLFMATKKDRMQFGIWNGTAEKLAGKMEDGVAYTLRMEFDGDTVRCRVSPDGTGWQDIGEVNTKGWGRPQAMRVGKTGKTGDATDDINTKKSTDSDALDLAVLKLVTLYGAVTKEDYNKAGSGLLVDVIYELYDGLPVFCKSLNLRNTGKSTVRVDSLTTEILATTEADNLPDFWGYHPPLMYVESDLTRHANQQPGASSAYSVNWSKDKTYNTSVYSKEHAPELLTCKTPLGPDVDLAPGGQLASFRIWELLYATYERQHQALARIRMYKALAPWVAESPIQCHAAAGNPAAVRKLIDQASDVGFEMVILSFGSGFNLENMSPQHIAEWKDITEYAHKKGVELGSYSLLASRRIDEASMCIDPETGKPGGPSMRFGRAPCLGSTWGESYLENLGIWFEKTGMGIFEHDGSYPGDPCASTAHPGHKGLKDSVWKQREEILSFYRGCREKGIYLPVPDWYIMNGSSTVSMNYRESNWSRPRAEQLLHARQHSYDGTWLKAPTMAWLHTPLANYKGGGKDAAYEPLEDNLEDYERILSTLWGLGVQSAIRGTRLYDTPRTKAMVTKWVDWYKKYRPILDSDLVHGRRADGRDLDWMLHVNPELEQKGMLVVWNPLDRRSHQDHHRQRVLHRPNRHRPIQQ